MLSNLIHVLNLPDSASKVVYILPWLWLSSKISIFGEEITFLAKVPKLSVFEKIEAAIVKELEERDDL